MITSSQSIDEHSKIKEECILNLFLKFTKFLETHNENKEKKKTGKSTW